MRLYSRTGATRIDGPHGSFAPGANGAFDSLPDAVYADLHGRPDWENEAERTARLAAEQLEKLRDPATMLAELQRMTASQGELTAILANAFAAARGPAAAEVSASAADAPPPGSEAADTGPEAESVAGPQAPAVVEESAPLEPAGADAAGASVAKTGQAPAKPPTKPRTSKKAAASPPATGS